MVSPIASFVAALAAGAWLCHAGVALAAKPELIEVSGSRVSLADVMPTCPKRACAMDLGPAPPPAVSWLVDDSVIRNALDSAGEDPKRFAGIVPVRVLSVARVVGAPEVGELARPSIERALPEGVSLEGVEARGRLTLPLHGTFGDATLPKLPRRVGRVTTTAMVDVLLDGTLVRRVPILVRAVLDASAARPDVSRGQPVTLVIERGAVTVSAEGVALRDAEVGEVVPFKVRRTGRVINARVKSAGVAVVLEAD